MANKKISIRQGKNEIPDSWTWTTIGEITTPVEKVKPQEQPDSEFIYVDISSIDNSINKISEPKNYIGADAPSRARQLIQANDVLFSTVRTYLRNIALVPEIYRGQIASTGFSVLRCRDGVSPKFLFYYTLTDDFISDLSNLQRGTSYPAVRDSDVREQFIPLAPFNEQKRIVAKTEELFSQLDAGVSELNRIQANLARYKASVLKAACEGRLVPTEAGLARAEGRDYESGEELLQRILAERKQKWEEEQRAKGKDPNKLKYREPEPPDSEDLPELPEGWVWATMNMLTETVGGVTKGRNFRGKPTILVPYLRVANVQRGYLDLDLIKHIEILETEIERYRLQREDLLLTEGGDWDKLGRSAIWNNQISNCIHQNHIFRARSYLKELPTRWLMYATNSDFGRKYFAESSKQTTNLASINLTQLRSCPIPLPPPDEQKRIISEVERLTSIMDEMDVTVDTNLRRSERMRQAVLKRAFEGKLVSQDPEDEPASILLHRIKLNSDDGKQLELFSE